PGFLGSWWGFPPIEIGQLSVPYQKPAGLSPAGAAGAAGACAAVRARVAAFACGAVAASANPAASASTATPARIRRTRVVSHTMTLASVTFRGDLRPGYRIVRRQRVEWCVLAG